MKITMYYDQFLLNKLMGVYNKSFGSMRYDLQFNHTLRLWEDFKKSSLNNPKRGLYECIEEYLKGNNEFINHIF